MIDVHGISGGYGTIPIVQDVSFHVQQGSFFALLGPNGSGKTTLLNMISGILPIQQGEIFLHNRPLHTFSSMERARLITVLGQEAHVSFDFTVEEIVALGRYPHQTGFFKWLNGTDRQIIEEAMNATDVRTFQHTPFRQLSGGEKQRVLLAKTFAQQPEILFLDEPTNHLDLHHTHQLLCLLKEWQQQNQLTVFSILHDVNVAALYADQIGILKDGRLVAVGDASMLKNEKQLEEVYHVRLTARAHPFVSQPQLMFRAASSENEYNNEPFSYTLHWNKTYAHVNVSSPVKTVSTANDESCVQWISHYAVIQANGSETCAKKTPSSFVCEFNIPPHNSLSILSLDGNFRCKKIEQTAEGVRVAAICTVGNSDDQKNDAIHLFVLIDGVLSEGDLLQALLDTGDIRIQTLARQESARGLRKPSSNTITVATSQRGRRLSYEHNSELLRDLLNKTVSASIPQLDKSHKRCQMGN